MAPSMTWKKEKLFGRSDHSGVLSLHLKSKELDLLLSNGFFLQPMRHPRLPAHSSIYCERYVLTLIRFDWGRLNLYNIGLSSVIPSCFWRCGARLVQSSMETLFTGRRDILVM